MFPILRLRNYILKNKIEILYCHLNHSFFFGYVLKFFFFPAIKLIYDDQGVIYDSPFIVRTIYRLAKKKVSLFIACSEKSKHEIMNKVKGLEGKIKFLPNIADSRKFKKISEIVRRSSRSQMNIDNNVFTVGFAGRIVRRKGWREFIEAANYLRNEKNILFLIAGIGPEKNQMSEMIRKYHLGEKIIYLGYVADMTFFYSLLDCFVLPSYWEGMSLAQLEANACGIPVLTSDAIQNGGNSFKVNDGLDLSNKILENKTLFHVKMQLSMQCNEEI